MFEAESRLEDERWNERLDAMAEEINEAAASESRDADAAWDRRCEEMAGELAQLDGGD